MIEGTSGIFLNAVAVAVVAWVTWAGAAQAVAMGRSEEEEELGIEHIVATGKEVESDGGPFIGAPVMGSNLGFEMGSPVFGSNILRTMRSILF
jgi:hypothetical protein